MAITFQCRCGRHLKARENNAGRRTVCPNCGAPVGIPTRRPTHRGAHEVSQAIIPTSRNGASAPGRKRIPGRALRGPAPEIRLRRAPRWMRLCGPTRGEFYPAADPILTSGLAIGLIAIVLAISGAFAVQLLPEVLHDGFGLPGGPLFALCVAAFLLAGAYAASFIGQAMTDIVYSGKHDWQFDPGIERTVRFAAGGLASLLGGPILFLAAGLWYWMNCGAMTTLDRVILAELAATGIGSWLALSCGSAAIGQFALTRPDRFGELMRGLGFRGTAILSAATVLIALHAVLAMRWCERFQNGDEEAVFWLGGCAFSGIVLATLLLSQVSRMSARRASCSGL